MSMTSGTVGPSVNSTIGYFNYRSFVYIWKRCFSLVLYTNCLTLVFLNFALQCILLAMATAAADLMSFRSKRPLSFADIDFFALCNENFFQSFQWICSKNSNLYYYQKPLLLKSHSRFKSQSSKLQIVFRQYFSACELL